MAGLFKRKTDFIPFYSISHKETKSKLEGSYITDKLFWPNRRINSQSPQNRKINL